MPSLKWRYDRESEAHVADGWEIDVYPVSDKRVVHVLFRKGKRIAQFRLLKNAKLVAELIGEG